MLQENLLIVWFSYTDFPQKYCCLYCNRWLIKFINAPNLMWGSWSGHSNDLKWHNKLIMKKKNDQSVHLSGQSGYPVCCVSWQAFSLILMRWSYVCQHMKVKKSGHDLHWTKTTKQVMMLDRLFFQNKDNILSIIIVHAVKMHEKSLP